MNARTRRALAGASFRWLFVLAIVATSCALLPASTVGGKLVTDNTPSFIATAKNLGAEDPAKVIEVSVWLQPHNRSQFDALAQSLYDRTSPNYRHWLKPAEIAALVAYVQSLK